MTYTRSQRVFSPLLFCSHIENSQRATYIIMYVLVPFIMYTYTNGTPLRQTPYIGEITFVLYKEVSFIQEFLNYDIFFNLLHNS